MSSPSIPSSPLPGTIAEVSALPPPPKPVIFMVSATINIPDPAPTQPKKGGRTPRAKVNKEEKTKEFPFAPTKANYLAFLQGILTKYGEARGSRRVSSKHTFPFKFYHKGLGLNKSTALSVDDADEYGQLVDKISKHGLETVHILVKMVDVEAKCPKRSSDGGDIDSGSEDDEPSVTQTKSKGDELSPLEKQIAQNRMALEKRYQVSSGYWEFDYRTAGVQLLILTPFLIREWAMAMVDGKATVETPPNTGPFDLRAQHRASLLASTTTGSQPSTGLDLAQMTTFLSAVAGIVHPRVLPETLPSTPTRSLTSTRAPPSPSDLARFLAWTAARPEYQLPDAQEYADKLRQESFDPDVILDLERDDLTSSPVRMTKGNAMRLKRACESWWNAPDGKRSRPLPSLLASTTTASSVATTASGSVATTASDGEEMEPKVRYELRWIDPDGTVTGRNSWFAPPMRRDENWTGASTPPDPATEGKVFYLDTARGNEWVEVPPEYIILRPQEKDSDF